MPKIQITIEHKLDQTEVRQRLEQAFKRIIKENEQRLDHFSHHWMDDCANFSLVTMNFKIVGKILIGSSNVKMHGTFPFAAMIFRNKIESVLKLELEELLSPEFNS